MDAWAILPYYFASRRNCVRITEMMPKECRELLARTGFGRLGCSRDNQPYIVPVYFAYDSDRLYGFSTFGRKVDWMRENPKVCIEVDEVKGSDSWTCVIVEGRYEELPDTAQSNPARQRAYSLLETRALWWQNAEAARNIEGKSESVSPIFYCIHIDAISGHRAEPDPVESDKPVIRVLD